MSKLESRIAEWRARMLQALPQRDETVAELEEHLRENCAELQRQGKSDDEAFAVAQKRMGEPEAIRREFDRMPAGWRPGLFLLPIWALFLAVSLGFQLWMWSERLPLTTLLVAFLLTSWIGFFAVVGSALIATSAFLKSAWRPLSERERLAVRRVLARLARLAAGFVAIGWVMGGLFWGSQLRVTPPDLLHYHLRTAGLFVSVVLLVFAHSRTGTSERVRWLTAILPCVIVVLTSFGRFLRVADFHVGWACVGILLAGQLFIALPRFRIRVERVRELK